MYAMSGGIILAYNHRAEKVQQSSHWAAATSLRTNRSEAHLKTHKSTRESKKKHGHKK